MTSTSTDLNRCDPPQSRQRLSAPKDVGCLAIPAAIAQAASRLPRQLVNLPVVQDIDRLDPDFSVGALDI
jgi:hypothetical protein